MFLQQFGGISALGYYTSSIFEGAGVSSSTGSRGIAILQISANGMGFGSFFLGLSFCLKDVKNMNVATPILAVADFLIFCYKCKGLSWKLGNFNLLVMLLDCHLLFYSFNFMMQWSSAGTFFFFSGISFSTVLFVAKIVPETKGRTLEEIKVSVSASVM
ncbi:Sugar transporter ERD6-like 5 [Citrus sinensis]|uniref:Sugar transporter ERD6-like 5 n=1 Tax=Citrus sinensis TaxID=2711 RepID=A0ACB8KK54_CITSI|nr:Sugar transporter ERD6-like 5 [Citrus sinensis]